MPALTTDRFSLASSARIVDDVNFGDFRTVYAYDEPCGGGVERSRCTLFMALKSVGEIGEARN